MGFLKNSIVFLAVFVAMDFAARFLNKFFNFGYYGLSEMYEEYTVNSQDLTDVVFTRYTAFLAIPLIAAFCISPIVRKWF